MVIGHFYYPSKMVREKSTSGAYELYFVYPLQINRMRVTSNKGEPSQSLYKQIQAFNNLDEELYKFAVTLFEKRIKQWRVQKTT